MNATRPTTSIRCAARKQAETAAKAKWGESAGVWCSRGTNETDERRFYAAPVKPSGALTNCIVRDQVSADSWASLIEALANASAPAGPGVGSVASADSSPTKPSSAAASEGGSR